MGDRVEYYPKLVTRIAQIGFCILLGLLGLWFRQDDTHPGAVAVGDLIVAMGAGLSIWLLFRLRDHSPRIIADDIGLYDRTLGTPLIPWKDIAAAKVVGFYGSAFIGILPVDEAERIQRLSLIRRVGVFSNSMFGLPAFRINPNGLNVPAAEVFREISKRLTDTGHIQSPKS